MSGSELYTLHAASEPIREVALHCEPCGRLAGLAEIDAAGRAFYRPVKKRLYGLVRVLDSGEAAPSPDELGPQRWDARGRPIRRHYFSQTLSAENYSWPCPSCDEMLVVNHVDVTSGRSRRRIIAERDRRYPHYPRLFQSRSVAQ